MNETVTSTAQDKSALREELAGTQSAYHQLVSEISAERWNAPSGNAAWTCGQLAWHVAAGVKFASGLISSTRQGKQRNPPAFLLPLAFKANEFLVRRNSRNATPESVRADYDAALSGMLALLDELRDNEFAVSGTNFGQTRTIAQVLHIPKEHFEEHAPEIRAGLATNS